MVTQMLNTPPLTSPPLSLSLTPAPRLFTVCRRDATLRELCDLVKEVKPAARGRSTRLSFGFVYPDKAGQPKMRIVGTVHATRPGRDDNKTLADLKFQTGDYLDVGINI